MSTRVETVSSKAQRRVKSIALIAGLGAMAAGLSAAATMPNGRPTPTGLEVPRWISLKSNKVRARFGPGLDHRILWEYRAAGLPVQVIAETREWRKVCDPDGSIAWIHRTVASGRRTAFNAGDRELLLRARPEADARVRARVRPRSVMSLERCEGDWCRVRVGKAGGWVAASVLFGSQERALCPAAAAAGAARGSD